MFLFESLAHTLFDGQVGVLFVISLFLWYRCFSEYIHLCSSLFFLFWTGLLLCYTYIRETGHTEILYSLVATHGSNGRSGHMGFWEWEMGFFFLGNGVYGWDCTSSSR